MANANFFTGRHASVSIGGVLLYGQSWEFEVNTKEIECSNFRSPTTADGAKWREFLAGFTGARARMKAINDPTLTQPQDGARVAFTCGIGGGHAISGYMVTVKRRYSTELETPHGCDFEGVVDGAPVFS